MQEAQTVTMPIQHAQPRLKAPINNPAVEWSIVARECAPTLSEHKAFRNVWITIQVSAAARGLFLDSLFFDFRSRSRLDSIAKDLVTDHIARANSKRGSLAICQFQDRLNRESRINMTL